MFCLSLESLQGTLGHNTERERGYLPMGMPRQGQHGGNRKLTGYASRGSGSWRAARGSEAQPCHWRSLMTEGEKLHSGDSCDRKCLEEEGHRKSPPGAESRNAASGLFLFLFLK